MMCDKCDWMRTLLLFLCLLGAIKGVTNQESSTSEGREFLLAYMDNFKSENPSSSDPLEYVPEVYVTTHVSGVVTVNISVPRQQELFANDTFTVTYGAVRRVQLPWQLRMGSGSVIESKGVLLTSSDSIAVYCVNLDEWTTDSYLALPLHTLGTDYFAVSVRATTHQSSPSELAIVASRERTLVNITIPKLGKDLGVEYQGLTREGEILHLTLEPFDVFQLQAVADFTGIRITSDHQVALLSGSFMAAVDGTSHDHLCEMLPPADTWGQAFYTVPMYNSVTGDLLKVVARQRNTTVVIKTTVTRQRKEHKLPLEGSSLEFDQSKKDWNEIVADKPILVVQISKSNDANTGVYGDPSMIIIPSFDQFMSIYTLDPFPASSHKPFNNYANIVCLEDDAPGILVDGRPLTETKVKWISIGHSAYVGTTVSLGATRVHTVQHDRPNATFGLWFYGSVPYESYGHVGGLKLRDRGSPLPTELPKPNNFTGGRNIQSLVEPLSIHPVAVKVISITTVVVVLVGVIGITVGTCFVTMKMSAI